MATPRAVWVSRMVTLVAVLLASYFWAVVLQYWQGKGEPDQLIRAAVAGYTMGVTVVIGCLGVVLVGLNRWRKSASVRETLVTCGLNVLAMSGVLIYIF